MSRRSTGCWTCRLRRKRCDERRPVCETCSTLQIDCNYALTRPEWMDSGVRQEAMAEQLKLAVKAQAPYRRRVERGQPTAPATGSTVDRSRQTRSFHAPSPKRPQPPFDLSNPDLDNTPPSDYADTVPNTASSANLTASPSVSTGTLTVCEKIQRIRPFSQTDSVLLTFYWEQLLPFLYPFYRPPSLHGGKAWILDLVISSPVVRQAVQCQSSYFFAIARGATIEDAVWQTLLSQANDAFVVLQKAINVIQGSGVVGHMHGAVRILAAIMQVQRFEIATLCFDNCRAHLNAALAIFREILDATGGCSATQPTRSYQAAMDLLGPTLWLLQSDHHQVYSAEQAAFHFATGLLLVDDIISSTFLQQKPQLSDYHHALLHAENAAEPIVDLETTVGCPNWVLLAIAETAALDAWKQQSMQAGSFDFLELAQRAMLIKTNLESHVAALDAGQEKPSKPAEMINLLEDVLATEIQSRRNTQQGKVMTRVWAHATFIYLSYITSGIQPASHNVKYHVGQVLELLMHELSPPSMLRTLVWPFCVVGCVAEGAQCNQFRTMVDRLQPASFFGPLRQAVTIMEQVWKDRVRDRPGDFATFFRSSNDNLVLLV